MSIYIYILQHRQSVAKQRVSVLLYRQKRLLQADSQGTLLCVCVYFCVCVRATQPLTNKNYSTSDKLQTELLA